MWSSEMLRLSASLWRYTLMLTETAVASESVIRRRSKVINGALRDPATADVAELCLMISEKAWAFSQAITSLMSDLAAMQLRLCAEIPTVLVHGASGSRPSTKSVARSTKKISQLPSDLVAASTRALTPIHTAATANRRRLKST